MAVYTYTHQVLGRETEAISGSYTLEKEAQFPYKGRNLYYYTGFSVVDTSCCGPGGCGFALVIGYIINWKNGKNDNGAFLSDIEPVTDDADRQEIRKMLARSVFVQQVNFWTPPSR